MKSELKTNETIPKALIRLEISAFNLPPIKDALIIGRKSNIGLNALERALEEMAPGIYTTIRIEDHPVIEGIIIRSENLRKLPKEDFMELLISHCEKVMNESDSLHISLDIKLIVEEELLLK